MKIDDRTKQRLKEYLPQYLESKGISPRAPFNCLNPEHPDLNPSMTYYTDGLCVKCFSCNVSYDIINLIQMDNGLDYTEAVKKGCEMYGIRADSTAPALPPAPAAEHKPYIDKAQKQLNDSRAVKYLQFRGISIDTAKRYGIGYSKESDAIVSPHSAGGYTERYINPLKKQRFQNSKGEVGLFNIEALQKTGEPVFICESFIDALSIIEAGGDAIGLNSVSNAERFIEAVKGIPADQLPLFLISTDNDTAGEKARQELRESGIATDVFPLPEEYSDVNEMHTAEPERLRELVRENNPLHLYRKQTGAGEWLSRLQQEADTAPPPISTGFVRLDHFLNGGLMPGLYVIGGLSSFGKTTYALQIAEQIAHRDTADVLFFSLEMSATELVAKGVSRRTWTMTGERKKASTATDIMLLKHKRTGENPPDTDAIAKAYGAYSDEVSNRLYIQQMEGERLTIRAIEEQIHRHRNATGNSPVIFIDYLQIIATENDKEKRLEIDHIVTTLKRLSRELKTPVIVISSLNRQSYAQRIGFDSFKESGGIEYSCDVLIGLQALPPDKKDKGDGAGSIKDATEKTRNSLIKGMEAVILKNRNGRVTDGLYYCFTAPFNCMEEIPFYSEDYKDGLTANDARQLIEKRNNQFEEQERTEDLCLSKF